MTELAGVIILGIFAQWMAWRFKIPAILPLILIGLLVGPIATIYTDDHQKLIEPIWNGENGLFPGKSLFYFVSLAISIILFEGGLTLKLKELKNIAPVISKLITVGALITLVGGAIAVHFLFDLTWQISILFSALIVVTGPTVISPILRNVPLKKDVSSVLKWEGILIDPIGALFAVIVYEFIKAGIIGADYTLQAFEEFGKILLFGFTFGFTFASGLMYLINKKIIPHYLINVFVLASVLGVFVLSDAFAHDSGLLSVVVMGMVLGNSKLKHLKELLYFKESLSVLLISSLFILLAANINLSELELIYRWETAVLLGIVIFVIRPLAVFLSSNKSNLKLNEKLFISWVGPRGIVAAGIASLFGLDLASKGVPGAEYITPLVFMVVLGTVLLNATTARPVAQLLGVFLKKSDGILIIGANFLSRTLAQYLEDIGKVVVLTDSNKANIALAEEVGLTAWNVDIYSDELLNDIELSNIGFLIALTGNTDINKYALEKYSEQFGENGSYRLPSLEELEAGFNSEHLLSFSHDYFTLSESIEKNPRIFETPVADKKDYEEVKSKNIIPLFIKYADNRLDICSSTEMDLSKLNKQTKLVYLKA